MDCFKLTSFDLNYLIFKYSNNLNIKSVYQKPFYLDNWACFTVDITGGHRQSGECPGSGRGKVKMEGCPGLAPGFTTFTVSLVLSGWLFLSTRRH